MDRTDCENEMVDNINQKIENELKLQKEKRQELGIRCCHQNELILEGAILPKITAFYNDEMNILTQNKISSFHSRLTHKALKQECVESVKRACSSMDITIVEFYCQEIEDALDKSFQLLSDSNNNKICNDKTQMEKRRASKLIVDQARIKYNEKMKVVTQNRMSHGELRLAHVKLKEKCVEAVKTQYLADKTNYPKFEVLHHEIDESIEKDFEFHMRNNEIKMEIFMAKVNLMVHKAQGIYFHLMESKQKLKIMTQRQLEDLHKETLNEASIILRKDLIPYHEDSETYIQKLSVLTKPDLEFFVEENQKRIREEKEKKELEKLTQQAALEKKVPKELFGDFGNNNNNFHLPVRKPESSERPWANYFHPGKPLPEKIPIYPQILLMRENWKQEALEKKEKLLKETREALGNSSNNCNLPIPKSDISEILLTTNYSLADKCLSGESSAINSQITLKNNSSIIAVEFRMNTVQIGVMLNGKFTIIPDRLGNSEFPNTVTITNADEFLIGHEVSTLNLVKCKWDISEIFNTPSDKLRNEKIHFRGNDILITKELLCGLILSKAKEDAEVFLKSTVDSVVLTVPLYYTSTQRQAAKDAAIIGGFSTVQLITEPTAAALAYAQQTSKIGSGNHLVIVADNNNFSVTLDTALYHYKEGKVEMVTCAGNYHHNTKYWNQQINRAFQKHHIHLIRSFLEECVQNENIIEFSLICSPGEIRNKILNYVNELYANANPVAQAHSEHAIVKGAAIFAELWNNDKEIAKLHISDILPYQFDYHATSPGILQLRETVFPRSARLSLTERVNSFPLKYLNADLNYNVYEAGNVLDFPTLEFVVSTYAHCWPRNASVNFFINWEGILRVTAHYTDTKEEILIKYSPLNINEDAIAINASLVASATPNIRLKEERRLFNDAKSELRVLSDFIMANLSAVQSVFGKDQMGKRAAAAIEALDHPNVTQEDINNRISVLTKLKNKYLK